MTEIDLAEIEPAEVRSKLITLDQSVKQIIIYASQALVTCFDKKIGMRFTHCAMGDILSAAERAQHICFVIKYENLPVLSAIDVLERDGTYYLGNLQYVLHVLNAFRPIIQNQDDSIYYKKIASHCDKMIRRENSSEGLKLTVDDIDHRDVTLEFRNLLSERIEAISRALRPLEFDYIYNGLLQHADERYSQRLNEDYCTGALNYVLLKHVFVLGFIKEMLYPFYRVMATFNFPKLGPL